MDLVRHSARRRGVGPGSRNLFAVFAAYDLTMSTFLPLPLSKSSQGGMMTALGTRRRFYRIVLLGTLLLKSSGNCYLCKMPPDRQNTCSDLLLITSPSIAANFCQYDPNTWENSQIIFLSLVRWRDSNHNSESLLVL